MGQAARYLNNRRQLNVGPQRNSGGSQLPQRCRAYTLLQANNREAAAAKDGIGL